MNNTFVRLDIHILIKTRYNIFFSEEEDHNVPVSETAKHGEQPKKITPKNEMYNGYRSIKRIPKRKRYNDDDEGSEVFRDDESTCVNDTLDEKKPLDEKSTKKHQRCLVKRVNLPEEVIT